jgi:hypothetical protein
MGVFKKTASPGVFSSFKGTQHSERLRLTFDEVQVFKRQLLKEEAALRVYSKATDEILKTTDDSLSAFPRVWRKGEEGMGAVLPAEDITKAAPTSKSLAAHPSRKFMLDLDMSMQDDVYTPLQRWHKQYKHIKVQISAVEAARHEYDGARKDVAACREAILKHARKTDGREDPNLNAHEAQAETILATKRERYIAVEHEVHNELVALAADSQAMLGLVAHALQLQAKALMDAGEALRTKEREMPIIERESSGPLSLGTGSIAGSPMGTPVGTPTAASPTGYGASFKSPGFEQSPPVTPLASAGQTGHLHPGPVIPAGAALQPVPQQGAAQQAPVPQQAAPQQGGVTSTPVGGETTTVISDSTPEEVAMRAREFKSPTPTSNLGDSGRMGRFDEQAEYEKEKAAETGGVGGAKAPNAQMSEMSVNDQQPAGQGVKDSVTELPSAPTHPVTAKQQMAGEGQQMAA